MGCGASQQRVSPALELEQQQEAAAAAAAAATKAAAAAAAATKAAADDTTQRNGSEDRDTIGAKMDIAVMASTGVSAMSSMTGSKKNNFGSDQELLSVRNWNALLLSQKDKNNENMFDLSPDTERERDIVQYKDIKWGEKLGEGSFGEVISGYLWGQHVAVKKMHVDIMSDAKKCADFLNEVEILRRLRHPNILQFMGACFEDPHFLIVTEYVGGGTLEDRIETMAETQSRMSSYTFFAINQQICKGLCWLHHKSVIHRDLKPANILIDKRLNVKIADFGLAHMKGHKTDAPGAYGAAGTPSYMAPEVLENRPYSVKADVFSHGVIMAEMLDGEYPWHAISQKSSITFENCIIDGVRPPIPAEADDYPGLAALITSCWEGEPSMRCSSDDVMEQLVSIDKACTKQEDATMSQIEPEAQKIIKDDRLRIQELEAQLNKATGRVARLESALQKSVAKKIDGVGSSSIAAATLASDKKQEQRAQPAAATVMNTAIKEVAAAVNDQHPADVAQLGASSTAAASADASAPPAGSEQQAATAAQ